MHVSPSRPSSLETWLSSLVVFLIAALVFAAYGAEGALSHDDGIYLYSGQQLVRGVPPYVSLFDHKGPLPTVFCALGVWVGHATGLSDVIAARFVFLGLSAATVAALFHLARALFPSKVQAYLTAAVFVGFGGYAMLAFSGPRAKTPMVLFEVLALLACVRKRWFWSAFFGSLAALTWQLAGVFALAPLLLSWLQTEGATEKRRAALTALSGMAAPFVVVSLAFAAAGSLGALVEGLFTFNFEYLDSTNSTLGNVRSVAEALFFTFHPLGAALFLGLFAFVCLLGARLGGRGPGLRSDPFAVLLVTFPAPVAWSLLDFQLFPDFFVFLPYGALGAGWFLRLGLEGVFDALDLGPGARRLAQGALVGLLATVAAFAYHHHRPRGDLAAQEATIDRMLERHGADVRIVSVGAQHALALMGRTNTTRFGFLMRGIEDRVAVEFPGGFPGWLRSLEDARPELLLVDAVLLDERKCRERLGTDLALEWRTWVEERFEATDEGMHDWVVLTPR